MSHDNTVKGAFWILASQAVFALLTFFMFVFLARELSTAGYGIYSAVLAFYLIIQVLLESGMTNSIARGIASGEGSLYSLNRFGFIYQAIWGIAVASALIAGARIWSVLVFNDPSFEGYIRIAALQLPFLALFFMGYWSLIGQERFRRAAVLFASWHAVRFVTVVILVFFRPLPSSVFYAFLAASVIGLVLVARSVPPGLSTERGAPLDRKHIAVRALMIIVSNIAIFSVYRVDKIFVKHIIGDNSLVGEYALASNVSFVLQFFTIAVMTTVFAGMSGAYARADGPMAEKYLVKGTKVLYLTLFPVALGMVMLGRHVLVFFFGERYASAYPPLCVLAFAGIFFGFFLFYRMALLSLDRQATNLKISVPILCAAFALNAFLVPLYGYMGAAWATLFCSLAGAFAGGICVFRILKAVYPWKILAVSGVTAAVFSYATSILSPGNASARAVMYVAAVLFMYTAACLTGQLSRGEIRETWAVLSRGKYRDMAS